MRKMNFNKAMAAALILMGGALVSPVSYAAPADSQIEAQQTRNVSGRVVDDKGEPVIGATIQNMSTKAGAMTDYDGRFSIEAEPGQTLQVYMLGYKDQTIKVTSAGNIDVVLVEDAEMLQETVVVGYATQKKLNVTGAVSSLSGETLERRPVTNVMTAL